ncbi:synaptonemal complex protein 1 isoform X2 [Alosa alosa]|uniref:synaptonemal complex protein 1 isoform X2 n=1 Tax=Alosa alosa TaxID=278164 RepID=UPI00201511A2|nr:synaptonemal complex protein 1 isoform X2 [Alosa alosa]
MERERGFNFRLLVPPRSNNVTGQVSAVKPQDIFEDTGSCGFEKVASEKGFNKCFEKELNMPFTSNGMTVKLPTKPNRTDVSKKIAVMPMEKEEMPVKSSQLYSKLFEEAEKIKNWKSKLDSEVSQKDRKLQENKRTIETQRKAIQELQFENESLSMKLEEQINENTDLRNKTNATRNLCNILKDTFERSSENINLFETEREETHHLFMQNSETIQRMIDAFEGLRIQAEHDQQEMARVREGLQQFEHLKETFEKEFSLKEEEVLTLQTKLASKENELKEISISLQDIQVKCNRLNEAEAQHKEMLQTSREEQDILAEKLQRTEVLLKESEEKTAAILHTLELTKQEHEKMIAEKVVKLEELITIQEQQADQLSELQQTVQALQDSLATEKQRVEELEVMLTSASEKLNQKNTEFGKITEQKEEADNHIQMLKTELEEKCKSVVTLEEQIETNETQILELTKEVEKINGEILQLQSKVTIMSDEREDLEKTLETAMNEQKTLREITQQMETKLQDSEEQLSVAQRKEVESEKEIERLKKDTEKHEEECKKLTENMNQLMIQKNTIQQQVKGSTSETKALEGLLKESKVNEEKSKNEIVRLEEEKQELKAELKVLHTKIEEQHQQTEELKEKLDACSKTSQNEATKKDKQVKALELKLGTLKTKLENKTKAHDDIQKEKGLLKQISTNNEEKTQLEKEITQFKEEAQRVQRCHEEELRRVSSDLTAKSGSEVKKLKQAAAEALKSKEDTEIKCQHKISDMVALMDKHKNQYDNMVKEKDSELEERMKKAIEISASKTSLELELSQLQIQNGHIKQQLDNEKKEMARLTQEVKELKTALKSQKNDHKQIEENLEKDITNLKKQMKSLKKDKHQVIPEISAPELSRKVQRGLATPKVSTSKRSAFSTTEMENDPFFATPSRHATIKVFETPQTNVKDVLQTPSRTSGSKIGTTPRIKSFRIRTPPSSEKSVPWQKNTLELDPKSDSSEATDLLGFEHATPSHFSAPLKKTLALDIKTPSPAIQKSPGAALKLAAMKRMRDAGWTAVANLDRKKKRETEKIFA